GCGLRESSMRAVFRIAVIGAVAAGAALVASSALAGGPDRVRWEVDADLGYSADVVQFTLTGEADGRRNVTSSPMPLNALAGLAPAQLQAHAPQPVAFRVQRDAGEFDCQGTAVSRHASGECVFRGSQTF